MLPTESLLTLSPIALTTDNLLSGVVGSAITLSIITGLSIGVAIGYFLVFYAGKEDDN